MYVERERFEAAMAVYLALAERRAGLGDAAVSLEDRLDRLQSAELQVCLPGVKEEEGIGAQSECEPVTYVLAAACVPVVRAVF